MAFKPGNLSLSAVRKLLVHQGCNLIGTKGGHEKWSRRDLLRPIIIQSHIDPVPNFVVLQIMRALGISRNQMERILSEL